MSEKTNTQIKTDDYIIRNLFGYKRIMTDRPIGECELIETKKVFPHPVDLSYLIPGFSEDIRKIALLESGIIRPDIAEIYSPEVYVANIYYKQLARGENGRIIRLDGEHTKLRKIFSERGYLEAVGRQMEARVDGMGRKIPNPKEFFELLEEIGAQEKILLRFDLTERGFFVLTHKKDFTI